VDGPPGIGCPVIASLGNADAVLLVTEPTVSAIHDLGRVVELAQHFNVEPLVLINKYDINKSNTRQIEVYCKEQNIKVLGKLRYDEVFNAAQVRGVPVVEYTGDGSRAAREIKTVWQNILELLT